MHSPETVLREVQIEISFEFEQHEVGLCETHDPVVIITAGNLSEICRYNLPPKKRRCIYDRDNEDLLPIHGYSCDGNRLAACLR